MGSRVIVQETNAPEIAARELLEKTLVNDGKIFIPIDVETVASMIGLDVMLLPLEDGTDGLLVKDEPSKPFKAVIDSNSNRHRRRFTLAHEIGHFVKKYQFFPENETAGEVERRSEMSSYGTDPEEIWANKFAAALLMPSGVMRRLWADNASVEEISDRLDVSIASIGHRLENLGLS